MRRLAPFVMSVVLCLTPSIASAVTIWDEAVQGDLHALNPPTPIGALAAGDNVVKGTLRSDALEFVDTFTFDVPIGLQLARVLLFATTSNVGGFTAFNVGPGPTFVLVTTIEGINLPDVLSSLDLLQFDSAPGPQPAGTYWMNVGLGQGTQSSDWSVTLVTEAAPAPEPGTLALLAVGAAVLGWRRARRA